MIEHEKKQNLILKMKTMKYLPILGLLALFISFTSCEDDMNVGAEDPLIFLSEDFFAEPDAYRRAIAGVYANLSLTGINGPGSSNIGGLDAGTSQYGRSLMNLQMISTDEAIWSYENDPGIREIQRTNWTAVNPIIQGTFGRIMASIAFANEFLRQSTDNLLDARNITGTEREEVMLYRAEARLLRALSYYHMMDLFGKAPFYDETIEVSTVEGDEMDRQELFNYVESELLAIENELAAPRSIDFGRADRGTAWMILTKIYLNAEVYIGEARYADALNYADQVIGAGYTLASDYRNNFRGDNNTNEAANEIIFGISADGEFGQSFGPTTVMTNGAVGSIEANGANLGVSPNGWGGALRLPPQFVDLFEGAEFENDDRNTIISGDRPKQITRVDANGEGYILEKYTNITSTGQPGSDLTFSDVAFPMFRLADAYLMYAEAHLRGGGGSASQALTYINALRERANGQTISANDLTLDFIIDERARELYWESHRRQDLIRFGKFSGSSYVWTLKGGSINGIGISPFRNLYPIPEISLSTNRNLTQNPGY